MSTPTITLGPAALDVFDALDVSGLAPGVYVVRLTADWAETSVLVVAR